MCVHISLSAGKKRGVFPKCFVHMPVHAGMVSGWQWVSGCSSKKMWLFVRFFSPSGSDNTSAFCFWWSVSLFTVCVHLNVYFFFVCCFCCLNTLSYLQSYWPHCPLFPFISYTVFYHISFLCSVLAAFFSTLLHLLYLTYLTDPPASSSCLLSPLYAFDTSGHFEVVTSVLKQSALFLFLSG